jgi:hypothetical protein
MNFYSDSIVNKPVEMLQSNNAKGSQGQDQEQLSPSDCAFHKSFSPFKEEFSELLSKVSTKVLRSELMTYQQRMIARALWQACNYGGRPTPGDLKNMEPERKYCEWVLQIDHEQQWKKAQKSVKLPVITDDA